MLRGASAEDVSRLCISIAPNAKKIRHPQESQAVLEWLCELLAFLNSATPDLHEDIDRYRVIAGIAKCLGSWQTKPGDTGKDLCIFVSELLTPEVERLNDFLDAPEQFGKSETEQLLDFLKKLFRILIASEELVQHHQLAA